MTEARLRWIRVGVLIAIPFALILPFLWAGDMLYGADVVSVFGFQRAAVAQAFREGRLPLWDSTQMCGFPLLAGAQAELTQ